MSKQYLIIGDLHLSHNNIDKCLKLFRLIESIGLPTIFLGDLLDKKGLIESECLNILYDYFKSSRLVHHLLHGNHSMVSMDSKESTLKPLSALSNVRLVDSPMFLHQNTQVLLVPYYKNPEEFLKAINVSGVKYLIGHQGIKEFTLGSGYSEHEAVNLNQLSRFKQIIMGHYHFPKEQGNVVYIGTPFSHTFGESNEQKRLAIFNEQDGIISYIDTDFPRHITIRLEISRNEPLVLDLNNYNRVILQGTKEQIDLFDRTPYTNVKWIEEVAATKHTSVLKEAQTAEVLYSKWFKEIKQETNEDIFKLGLDILEEVK